MEALDLWVEGSALSMEVLVLSGEVLVLWVVVSTPLEEASSAAKSM